MDKGLGAPGLRWRWDDEIARAFPYNNSLDYTYYGLSKLHHRPLLRPYLLLDIQYNMRNFITRGSMFQ